MRGGGRQLAQKAGKSGSVIRPPNARSLVRSLRRTSATAEVGGEEEKKTHTQHHACALISFALGSTTQFVISAGPQSHATTIRPRKNVLPCDPWVANPIPRLPLPNSNTISRILVTIIIHKLCIESNWG